MSCICGCPLDSRITWSVLLSMDAGMALQPQSVFAELRQVGHWKAVVVTGAEAVLCGQLWAASCSAHHSSSSDALSMHASGGRPGLLCWVQKVWCHTTLVCSSVYLCSAFVASLVFFVLVLVHQRTAALVYTNHPSQMMWPPQHSWAFSSSTSMEVDLAQSRALRLVILFFHWIPRMEQSAHILIFSSCLMWWQ